MHQSKYSSGWNALSVLIGGILVVVLSASLYVIYIPNQEPNTSDPAAETAPIRAEEKKANTGMTTSPSMGEKEAAFKLFYKKDPACDSFRDDNAMDRCRNKYATAKQEFEKMWAAQQAEVTTEK